MVEGARLESVCRGNSTAGSNPALSANLARARQANQADALRSRGETSDAAHAHKDGLPRSRERRVETANRHFVIHTSTLRQHGGVPGSTFLGVYDVEQRRFRHVGVGSAPHRRTQRSHKEARCDGGAEDRDTLGIFYTMPISR